MNIQNTSSYEALYGIKVILMNCCSHT